MANKSSSAKPKPNAARLVEKYLVALDAGKAGYKKADELLKKLAKVVKPGEAIELTAGRSAVVEDQFADRDQVGGGYFCKRWKLKVTHTG